MPLEKIGYQAVVEGAGQFTADLKRMATEMEGFDKAQDKVAETSKRNRSALEALSDGLKKFRDTTNTVISALSAFTGTIDKAFDLGREGAVIVQTRDSFNTLLETVGAAPDTLDKLRAASKGTVDDLTLMSSTMTLAAGVGNEMSKSLIDAAPRILEIAKAANKLNPTLGSTTFLYESLMTGIKRSSPMIIDNTGLQLRLGAAMDAYAISLGKSVEQLTADERTQALLNATLEAGERLIKQVGGTTDSATDSFDRYNTAVKNLEMDIKSKFVPVLTDAATAMSLLLTWTDEVQKALTEHEREVFTTTDNYKDYAEEMIRAAKAAGYLAKETEDGIKIYRGTGSVWKDVSDQFNVITAREYDLAKASERSQKAIEDRAKSYAVLSVLYRRQKELATFTYEQYLSKSTTELVKVQKDYFDELTRLNIAKSEEERITREAHKAYNDLKVFMAGKLGKEIDSYNERQSTLRDRMAEVVKNIQEIKGEGANLTKSQREEVTALEGELANLKNQYEANAEAHRQATASILIDLVSQQLAISGLPIADQVKIIGTLAETWGLVDAETKAAYTSIGEWIGQVEAGKISVEKLIEKVQELAGEYDVKINIETQGRIPSIPGGGAYIPMQTGGDFIVPPGYNHDNFRLGVSSGERVIVIPKSQVQQTNYHNRTNNFNISVHSVSPMTSIYQAYHAARLAVQ